MLTGGEIAKLHCVFAKKKNGNMQLTLGATCNTGPFVTQPLGPRFRSILPYLWRLLTVGHEEGNIQIKNMNTHFTQQKEMGKKKNLDRVALNTGVNNGLLRE